MISKMKPKIRIIHIFAPEIIKTDVANFRELVQRLTGKPTTEKKSNTKRKPRIHKYNVPRSMNIHKPVAKKSGFSCSDNEYLRERIKGEEEEIWRGANSGGDFLGGFGEELEGFMEFQLNNNYCHEFIPFLHPNMPVEVSHMDANGQSQLA
ncbi:hypothetical protein ACH5RR_007449 [Cinchona calisaya]|uniref:VQ domain-containing protein n=1 Tax=Cinchona calisaya TaxID=153742 RepID=A0ABD3AS55_9GENT